jgi:hypothetical protein
MDIPGFSAEAALYQSAATYGSGDLSDCALAPDSQACYTAVWMRCATACIVACDAQYGECLGGQG